MLSTVYEFAETEMGPEFVFIKVLVLGIMAIIGMVWVYQHTKNH